MEIWPAEFSTALESRIAHLIAPFPWLRGTIDDNYTSTEPSSE